MDFALSEIPELSRLTGPVSLAIGVFDGVHLGHRAVLHCALQSGAPTVCAVTFDPHPTRFLRPDQAARSLTCPAHKARLIRELGVHHLLTIRFDADFAALTPSAFIGALAAACRPLQAICVGRDWTFGAKRAGNFELLTVLGKKLAFDAIGVPSVLTGDEPVSSTAIRKAVEVGDLERAKSMLGRPSSVLGIVETGQQLARTLGFPTANVALNAEQLPPDGVYAVSVDRAGTLYPGVANLGIRPTVQADKTTAPTRVLEVHILDFRDELVGEELEVQFLHYLRGEVRFPSLEALKTAIAADVQSARNYFSR